MISRFWSTYQRLKNDLQNERPRLGTRPQKWQGCAARWLGRDPGFTENFLPKWPKWPGFTGILRQKCGKNPIFQTILGKLDPFFREFFAQNPARPGGTSLSAHIVEYLPGRAHPPFPVRGIPGCTPLFGFRLLTLFHMAYLASYNPITFCLGAIWTSNLHRMCKIKLAKKAEKRRPSACANFEFLAFLFRGGKIYPPPCGIGLRNAEFWNIVYVMTEGNKPYICPSFTSKHPNRSK